MNVQPFLDFLITVGVLLGIFIFAYSAYRHQGLKETIQEIKDIFYDTTTTVVDNGVYK